MAREYVPLRSRLAVGAFGLFHRHHTLGQAGRLDCRYPFRRRTLFRCLVRPRHERDAVYFSSARSRADRNRGAQASCVAVGGSRGNYFRTRRAYAADSSSGSGDFPVVSLAAPDFGQKRSFPMEAARLFHRRMPDCHCTLVNQKLCALWKLEYLRCRILQPLLLRYSAGTLSHPRHPLATCDFYAHGAPGTSWTAGRLFQKSRL